MPVDWHINRVIVGIPATIRSVSERRLSGSAKHRYPLAANSDLRKAEETNLKGNDSTFDRAELHQKLNVKLTNPFGTRY